MLSPIDPNQIQEYFGNERVIRLVFEQLSKDCYPFIEFSIDGLDLSDDSIKEPIYERLVKSFSEELERTDRLDHSNLLSLIYRVDLNKQRYNACVEFSMNYDCLARELLNREFKKVLFRLYYQQMNDQKE